MKKKNICDNRYIIAINYKQKKNTHQCECFHILYPYKSQSNFVRLGVLSTKPFQQ